jgi:Glycosyltransferase Family 4
VKGWHCLRILITNHSLVNRAGTELYVRDVSLGLADRGEEVTAYAPETGDVARDLRAAGVRVTEDLTSLNDRFDIIHGQHHLETMTALLRLPETPAIYFCHGSTHWQEAAPKFPRILRYVAVDEACRDRLMLQHAIPPDQIRLILNFVDLGRFKPRAPLPDRPRRALIFSNQASENNYAGVVRTACQQTGMSLDVVGFSAGTVCADPEEMLRPYDIVFAKGRAALEALAVGAAVIVCDAAGLGPMVTAENVSRLRPLNFGIRLLRNELTVDAISAEIARYDPGDATDVSSLIRNTAGRDMVVDQLLALYREVIEASAASRRKAGGYRGPA